MSEKNCFYLLEPFQSIPVDNAEEWLARIVSDYRRPHVGYTPQQTRKPYFRFHSDPDYSNIARVLNDISTTRVQLSLLDILDISHEDFKSKKHTFQSRKVQRLRIHHDEEVLKETLSHEEVTSDIKGWGLDMFSPMYFVVGLLVTEDITYRSSENVGHSNKVEIDPAKAGSLAFGATNPAITSAKIGAAGSHEQPLEAKTHASSKRIFAVEYRSFRRHLRQRPGRIGKLSGYGPQGDRTFGPTDESDDDIDVHVELDPEPFSEIVEIDEEEERYITLDDISTLAAKNA